MQSCKIMSSWKRWGAKRNDNIPQSESWRVGSSEAQRSLIEEKKEVTDSSDKQG